MIMPNPLLDIRIGTMVRANLDDPAGYVRQILPLGFESIQPFFWQSLGGKDIPRLAGELREAIGNADVTISSVGVFGNPLEDGDNDRETLAAWETRIDNAHLFGANTVSGFTGRIRGKPLTDSLPRFREVWGKLAERAADKGVRIAFENCAMDGNWATGDWNIAHNPDAWELMFNELPNDNLGLEWEPCHQLVYLIDPVPQIKNWAPRIFHVHGKDATVRWDVIREHGIFGKLPFVQMRTPGFGDSDWVRVIGELRLAGYRGTIDIEGWHDPVYRNELEITGQVRALNYLKECRGGAEFVPNPAS
jgi:sugar phosphate isomerase/epimerase